MKPRDKCIMTPRIYVEKGWGSSKIDRTKGLNFSGSNLPINSKIGEIFVYHKLCSKFFPQDKNPTFDVGTVKLLYIEKDKRLSNHFHIKKQEIFFMVKGCLELTLTSDGISEVLQFKEGDCLLIHPGMVHQMKGVEEENILLEVSTLDEPEDSYRVQKGD